MENNNEEQIRNKFEKIFQYENNKDAFLDYFYGRTNSCHTSIRYYLTDDQEIFKFYFDENTKEEDKKALSRYAATVIKYIYKGDTTNKILRLCVGEDLEKVLIESYNITYEREYGTKYAKSGLIHNEANKYIQIQVNNLGGFLGLEYYTPKDFNQYLEKVKNDNEILLKKAPHLLLTIFVYLINRDDDKSLIKQLLNYIDSLKINDEETTALLFTIADKDEEVYKRLINILNKDNNMIYFLVNISREMLGGSVKLYKRLFKSYSEDKLYYYYTRELIPEYLKICSFPKECILLSKILNDNTLFISKHTLEVKKLYDEDKETFYKLYEIIEKSKFEQLYLDYAMLSSIMLASGDNKYNIDINSIVAKLKEICVYLLETNVAIKSFDEIISKSIKYVKENPYSNHSHYLSAIMSLDEVNDEASEITTKLLKHYGIYGKISIYVSTQKIFYNRDILSIKEKLVNDKKVQLKDIYLSLLDSKDDTITLIKNNLEETKTIIEDKSFITSITANIQGTISFIDYIFSDKLKNLIDNKFDFVFKVLDTAKSKEIKKHCVSVISNNESIVRSEVEKLANEGKEASKTVYKEIIKYWDLQKFDDDFKFKSVEEIEAHLNKYYNEGHESLIKDIDENILSNILLKDKQTKAPLKIVQYVFMEYIALKEPSILKDCNKIAEFFDNDSFRNALDAMYSNWLNNKADTKLKNILIPYCIFQPEDKLLKLKTQIEEWALNSRGALAAHAVYAIALNASKFALVLVDTMSVKVKNNQVKNAAKDALKKTAKALEISEDELIDKIIPDLDFDKKGMRELHYGGEANRVFKLQIKNDFTIEVTDSNDKVLKSLPAPNSKDDKAIADASKKELTLIKKNIKMISSNQMRRLNKVLLNGRKWSYKTFNELFVDNPIMNIFALKLIWGVYDENNNLIESFRYMEDGSFNTFDEEEYIFEDSLKNKKNITLVHPIELDEEKLSKWRNQLSDYEILQPINQLNLLFEEVKEEHIKNNKIISFEDKEITAGEIMSMANKMSFERSRDIEDGGSYNCYELKDSILEIACRINFEYMWFGMDASEKVTFIDITFHKLDENSNYDYEECVNPLEINKRFTSSIYGTVKSYFIK
ncbi:DUF4132 domain-containing protein [Brachyspira pilosicoli]|uniref:DUF4132 domain-containing protein n=1 Tax=Brachyspira pilosicoli TaxID=52584 RepID=A0AAJ6KC71_BRAPL|nr:DUF4132 domain-containing protein [Brachyspira pilosicoli]WIH90642.1 DUF4132 domain-containing protein [Brachyspira pilosicoli]WIH92933.1 DUF4132 domain-containing protein [Brachyspira pilosicoli]WIH95222.1 DUF4132 domain-containing protein [Brachyspira pilosicoli]